MLRSSGLFERACPGVDVRRCRRLNSVQLKARKSFVFFWSVGKHCPAILTELQEYTLKLLAWAC